MRLAAPGDETRQSRVALYRFAVLVMQRYDAENAFAIPSMQLTQNGTSKKLSINGLTNIATTVLTHRIDAFRHKKDLHPRWWDAGRQSIIYALNGFYVVGHQAWDV